MTLSFPLVFVNIPAHQTVVTWTYTDVPPVAFEKIHMHNTQLFYDHYTGHPLLASTPTYDKLRGFS